VTRGVAAYTLRMVLRTPGRSLTLVSGLALGVALVVSVLFFVESSSRQFTQTAIAPVPVDMVGHATTATLDEPKVISQFRAQPVVATVEPFDTVDLAAMSKPGGAAKTPPAKLFAIDRSFLTTFDLLRVGAGAFDANGVLVSEATASRLGLKTGDAITLEIPALAAPYQTKVTGVLDTSHAAALFLSGDPQHEGEFQVVPNVAVMDRALFNKDLRGPLLSTVAPPPANPAAAPKPGSTSGTGLPPIDQQQYIKIDRSMLPANPGNAAVQVEGLRHTLERQFTGEVKITNNIGGALTSAKGDVLSAKMLFIFLGLPGIALAVFLARYASELFGEAQRREIGLLRARGASSAQVISIAAASAAVLGVAGSALGLGLGTLVTLLTRGNNALADASTGTFLGIVPWALGAGLVMAVIASFMPTWNAVHQNVTAERRRVKRTEKAPFWKRSWLDVGMLIAAAVVLVIVNLTGGFKPSGAEGQSISLSFYLFLAPLFLWIGLALFMQRLLVRFIPIFAKSAAGRSSGFGQVAARGMGWRANRLSSAITIIALTLSFGVSLALFTSTFDAQKVAGRHYVIGSDVRITPALGVTQDPNLEQRLLAPGATSVTGVMRDGQALIGSEHQVIYGIDVPSFEKTAFLPDSFVEGGSANDLLAKLQSTPNGVIVSREAATTLGLVVGDPLLARLSTAGGGYNDVRLQVVGAFTFFPTSSQDSDFVMNRSLMAQTRGATPNGVYLVRADGTDAGAASVAAEIKAGFSSASPARVEDLTTALTADQSTLTSLNMSGLSRIDRIFTLVIAFAGFGIFLLASIAERAKEFSTMRAVGASPGQLRRLVVIEGGSIMLFGVLLSLPIGFVIARVLVTLLTSIFLTPVGGLFVSLAPLLLLIAVSAAGLTVALGLALQVLPRISLGTVLREE